MRHITLLLMAAATICTSAFAQPRPKYVYTSSTTLNVEALQNQAQPVVLNRTLFAGYNTICLPMSLNAEQLKAAAKDVQVERLEMVRQEGNTLCMYFLDCTNEGIEAGVPYLIFSPTFQSLRANTEQSSGINAESAVFMNGCKPGIVFDRGFDREMKGFMCKPGADLVQEVQISQIVEEQRDL